MCLSAAATSVSTPLVKLKVAHPDKKSRPLDCFFLCVDKRHICATRIGRQDKVCVAAYLKTLKTHRFWGEELATYVHI